MERQIVDSSTLASVGYESNVLEIEFHNGRIYQYFYVPEFLFLGLMKAGSHGTYFNQHIRHAGYEHERIS